MHHVGEPLLAAVAVAMVAAAVTEAALAFALNLPPAVGDVRQLSRRATEAHDRGREGSLEKYETMYCVGCLKQAST